MSKKNETEGQVVSDAGATNEEKKFCGIIMPIAAIGDYTENHWTQVINILERGITLAGFTPRLVSEAKNAQVILNSIVQNIYDDEIVVCDVSGRNPNVMFELGMRLAFNKPVVIVKDYETNFSFDISSIKHVLYPRNMNFHEIEKFIDDLNKMVKATHEESQKEGHKTFLDSFSRITVANIKPTELSQDELLSRMFMEMKEVNGKLSQFNSERNNKFSQINFESIYKPKSNSNIPNLINDGNAITTFEFFNSDHAYNFYKIVKNDYSNFINEIDLDGNEIILWWSLFKNIITEKRVMSEVNKLYKEMNIQ